MKKFLFGLLAVALFAFSTSTSTAQTTDCQETVCYNASGQEVDCMTGEAMGQPKKKRKKR